MVNDDSDRAFHEGIEPSRADRQLPEGGQHRRQGGISGELRRGCRGGRCEPRAARSRDAITAWAGADIFGAHVHFDVQDVTERPGRTIVRVKIDGTFDRTGLPDPLVMNHEFKVAEGKIAELRIGF
jgi:hypothetical protein